MFRITPRVEEDEIVLKLEGCLTGAASQTLDACWRDAVTARAGSRVRVDLRDAWYVDQAGRELMTRMCRAGVQFVSAGCVVPEIVREIAESVERERKS